MARMLQKNKQNMYYSLFDAVLPRYEVDDDGNIIYDEIDGEQVPREDGTTYATYGSPQKFSAIITSELNELHMRAWGVDQSSIYSQITVDKGYLPKEFTIGTIVWRTAEIEYEDAENKIPKIDSAEYTVKGINTEGLLHDLYLLQRNA